MTDVEQQEDCTIKLTTSVKVVVIMVASLLVLCLMATTTLVAIQHVQLRDITTKLSESSVSLKGDVGLVQDMSNAQGARIEQLAAALMMLVEVLQGGGA